MGGKTGRTSKLAAAMLLIVNFVVMMACGAVFALSLWIIVSPSSLSTAIDKIDSPVIKTLLAPQALSASLGVALALLTLFFFFVAFMGFCGAVTHSQFLLVMFYIHSPYDILNIRATPFEVHPATERPTELSVMESGCGRGVRELSPRRRRCLYTDEPLSQGRQVYSTNSCRRSCRNQEALRDCQCKPFYNHYEDGVACSLRGMRCLAERAARDAARASFEAAHAKAAKRAGVKAADNKDKNTEDAEPTTPDDNCSCPLMCVDALFEILSLLTKRLDGPFSINGVSRIKIQAPRTRYTREIVFYFQDLIVSFGGAAGLFLGASFISFVEILFFAVEWLVGAPTSRQEQPSVKKTKISHEQTRIQHLNAILEDERLPGMPGYWHSHLHA